MTRGRVAGIVAAAVVAAVLGFVFAGRGAGSPVAAAATKTGATSAHLDFSLTLRGPKLGGKTVDVNGSGGFDATSADVTIADSGAPAAVPTSIHALLLQQNGHELAFVHATPMPSLAGGKDWIEVDLTALASSHGLDLGSLGAGISGETPGQILDLLRGAGASVTNLGTETVGGVPTTHYRVAVDAAELVTAAGLPFSPTGKRATKTLPVDVWIGTADGLVHRVALTLKHASFSATLSDYGTSVSVSAPPSSDVLDVTSLLGLATSH